MKKPVNKFAVALWVVAAIVLIGGVGELVTLREALRSMEQQGGTFYQVAGSSWRSIVLSILPAVQVAAMGVLIELVDQIRWNALRRESRD